MTQENLQFGKRVAAFAVGTKSATLPDDVALKTKIHILDTLAAIVSGAALEAGLAGQRYAGITGGHAQASIIGTNQRSSLIEAALANGMAAHADESDDSHEDSQTHPGCGVLPAALVVAEARKVSGRDFLNAVYLGYEMTIRFGEAMSPAMSFARSSLSCHAYGPLFGAGYASGSLMGFDAERFQILLNYLAQEASGMTTWRLDGAHTLKSYVFAGMPASNAVKAALLVDSGFTGSGDVIDPADRNFFEALSPATKPERLFHELETRHKILETDIKKYSVGFPIAAPLAALEDIMARDGFDAAKVSAIRLRYDPDWYKVIGDLNRMPDLNLRHCMAAMLVEGRLGFDASHDPERMKDEAILAMGRKIDLKDNDAGQDRFEARVEVECNGQIFEASQGLNVLGRKENPMTTEQVVEKATELLCTVLSEDAAKRTVDLVFEIESEPSIDRLVAAMRPEGQS
ncbi:MmgE/PrpD family protein [Aureimonas fodinaquatilis]|uniref:MmgE/PrpD family protein n=1 Tax=Aureimonas fodinaquatilis TaxID=2565783 RepID=A0A5B0DUQ9_9HYPH|nr:MmgE/PrpD family protein [Aureimonas fodinaquatilis]KAA0970173.1 MmgE/PrpD family protein [Aureimonas fodinaquatilis]